MENTNTGRKPLTKVDVSVSAVALGRTGDTYEAEWVVTVRKKTDGYYGTYGQAEARWAELVRGLPCCRG